MSIALRVLPIVVLLIGTSGSWAYDDAASLRGQDPACSSLCRSWMNLGHSEGESADVPRAAAETPDVPSMKAALPARPTPTPPIIKPAKAGPVVSRHVVPPARPHRDARRQPATMAAGTALPLNVAAVVPVRTLPVAAIPVIQPPPPEAKPAVMQAAPTIQPPSEAKPLVVAAAPPPVPAPVVIDTRREVAVEIVRPAPSEPVEPTSAALRLTPPVATPLSVKAAMYLALAAFALWGFHSRPASRRSDVDAQALNGRGTVPRRSAAPSIGRLATARD